MPQGPIQAAVTNLVPQGGKNVLNITAATVIKAAPGTLLGIAVLVAGSAAGSVNDCATLAAVANPGNEVLPIPATVGAVQMPPLGIPCTTGITVTPGTGQTLAVFYV